MIITRNWLSKYLDLSKISNQAIGHALNSLGFEVEKELDYAKINKDLFIGFIEKSNQIKDTHLKLNTINFKSETKQIVCGAKNIVQGQYVIVGKDGSIVNGLKLGDREIKGNLSQGMVCALSELGFSTNVLTEEEKNNIYPLVPKEEMKQLLGCSIETIGFDDYSWECDLTLNRSDALAALQLVKELANYFKLNLLSIAPTSIAQTKGIKINIDNVLEPTNLRTIVVGQITKENEIDPILFSKDDLLMKMLGIKATDNIYETLAAYSAFETGQPIILIDKAKVSKSLQIAKEIFDQKEILVVKDGNNIVTKIGMEVEQQYRVTNQTKDILVLILNFDPIIMRKQQKNLNLTNIALQRYMKPLNPNIYQQAYENFFNKLSNLIELKKWAKLDIIKNDYVNQTEFIVMKEKIKNLLGIDLSFDQIEQLFSHLDFKLKNDLETIEFKTDPNRMDLYGFADICEEIARLYGYDKFIETPPSFVAQMKMGDIFKKNENKLTNHFIGLGFNNTKTYALLNEQEVLKWNLFKLAKPVKLMSPLSIQHEVYRLSLISSLISVAITNSANGNKKALLWEIANIHTTDQREKHLAFITVDDITTNNLTNDLVLGSYEYVKGLLTSILAMYNINQTKIEYQAIGEVIDEIHPYINAKVVIDNIEIGYIFKLNPAFEKANKIAKTFCVEINLDKLQQLSNQVISFKEWSKFQESSRDISVQIETKTSYDKLLNSLTDTINHLVAVKLLDEFENDQLKALKSKAMTFKITFNSVDHQLTDKEIELEFNKIITNVEHLGGIIR